MALIKFLGLSRFQEILEHHYVTLVFDWFMVKQETKLAIDDPSQVSHRDEVRGGGN